MSAPLDGADRRHALLRARAGAAYLVVQAVAYAVWWGILLALPGSRASFTLPGAPEATLLAFAPADLFVIVSSLFAAHRAWEGRPPGLALGVVVGAIFAMTLYCIAAAVLEPRAFLPALFMGASAVGTACAACAACALVRRGAW